MKICIFNDGSPATGQSGPYADRCWRHTPEEQDRYPVLVTYTTVHVVWIEGDSPAGAAEAIRDEPYEYTDGSNCVDGWSDVKAPEKWDWRIFTGLDCRAHVDAYHRHQYELARAAEAAVTR